MSIDQKELGFRLKAARSATGLTQEQVAERMAMARSAVANIERGDRAVSSIELERLAYVYGRSMSSFFVPVFQSATALDSHFRSTGDVDDDPAISEAILECLHVGREMHSLEVLTGIAGTRTGAPQYSVPVPPKVWPAIRQGRDIADRERKRLRFDDGPVADLVDLLAEQGVRVAVINLPEDVSGLTLVDPDVGPLIVVNRRDHVHRRTFSIAHEYAHVLMDRTVQGLISRKDDKGMLEVRANAFAGAFLMPEDGIRRFLAQHGKSAERRVTGDAPLSDGSVPEGRSPAGSNIGISDVALLADHFNVTRVAMIMRLSSLNFVSKAQRPVLDELERSTGRRIAVALGIREPDHETERNRFQRHMSKLSMDAYEQDQISAAKLMEHLIGIVGMERSEAEGVVDDLDLAAAS